MAVRTKKNRERGISLVEVLVGVALLSLVMVGIAGFFKPVARSNKSNEQRAEIEAIRRTVLNLISCGRTLEKSPACPATIEVVDTTGGTLIAAGGTKFGEWTLLGRCASNVITVDAALLRPDAPVTTTNPADFQLDPMTKRPMDWAAGAELLFHKGTSPCPVLRDFARHPLEDGVTVFKTTAGGTYNVPRDVTRVMIEAWGGGGGGAGGIGGRPGHGAGGGAYAKAILDVTPGTSYAVTVGGGGTGAAACGGVGTDGQDTILRDGAGAAILVAGGGKAGTVAAAGIGGVFTVPAGAFGQRGGPGLGGFPKFDWWGPPEPLNYSGGGVGGSAPQGGLGDTYSAAVPVAEWGGTAPGGGGRGGLDTPSGSCVGTNGAVGRLVVWAP